MKASETLADAQMNLASVAHAARFHSPVGLMAAYDTVALLADAFGEVLAGQRMSRMQSSSAFTWSIIGRQLLEQLVHEFLAEAQLPVVSPSF